MPFKSEAQRRYLWANEPEIARDWADTYGSRIEKNDGGIMRVGLKRGSHHDTSSSSGGPPGGGATSMGSGRDVGRRSARANIGQPPGGGSGGQGGVMHYQQPKQPSHVGDTTLQSNIEKIGAPPGMNTGATHIPQQQNFMQKGMDLYNKYGILPNAIRFGQNLFKGPEPGTMPKNPVSGVWGPQDYLQKQPTLATSGGDGQGQQQYPPWWYDDDYAQNILDDENEELDIDTSTGDMDEWIQRFRVKDPYRQDRGELDEQIKEYVSKLYTTP